MEKKTTCTARGISGKLSFDSTPHASLCNDDAHQAGSFHFKAALPVDEQIDHLVEQGIVVENRQFAEFCLLTSNYYRLRGYWMTFEEDGAIRAGTRLEDIWAIHEFDREVRLWLWKLIERVEIKARTQFAYVLSNEFGADAHLQAELFFNEKNHKQSLGIIEDEIGRAKNQNMPCVIHNLNKYGELPLWAAVEVMSMGVVSALYGNLRQDAKADEHEKAAADEIASVFGVSRRYLVSWLRHLTMVRNICAHHNRFYNRLLKSLPLMLRRDKRYAGNREFPTFVVLSRIYEKSWPSVWQQAIDELDAIVARYPNVSLKPMGFPEDWRDVLGLSAEAEVSEMKNFNKRKSLTAKRIGKTLVGIRAHEQSISERPKKAGDE